VAAIVRRHRGEIFVASKPGSGSVFTVKLPMVTTPAPPAESAVSRR
jgi:signal transduction histidine kinase